MSRPFSTTYSTNTSVQSIDISTFITGASASPTPNTGSSYARYQKIGSIVQIEFKYVFSTTGTTGAMSFNLPIPMNSTYSKPQGYCNIRYAGSASSETFIGHYNENNSLSIHIVSSATYGGVPAAFTNLLPKSGLAANDIISGVITYES